jgi:hypothetical protein
MEKSTVSRHLKLSSAGQNPNLSFVIALLSGIFALLSAVLLTISGWSIITLNSANAQSLISQYLSSSNSTLQQAAQELQYLLQITTLVGQSLVYLFLPLLAIAGAFMILTAFYLRSKNKKRVIYGTALALVFSLFVFIGLVAYLPFSPATVSALFTYIGTFQGGNSGEIMAAYGLFMAYIVFGLAAAIFGLYRVALLCRS